MSQIPQPAAVPLEDLLEHAGWVRGLAGRLVADGAEADDLVQETWLAAMRKPPSGDRPVRGWLAGVVRNLARQRARGEGRRARREADRTAPAGVPAPDALAERLETQRLLAAEVARLPEPHKSTVLLRYFEDLSSAEIARRQGVPAGTVRWRLKQALDALRVRLDARFDGDRRAWLLLLVPVADLPSTPGAGAGPGAGWVAALVQGVVAMSVLSKVSAGAALVLLAAGGLVWTDAVPVPEWLGGGMADTPEDVSFRPEAVVERTRRTREPRPAEPGEPTTTAPARDPAPITTKRNAPATVRARLVDQHGRPLTDALLLEHFSGKRRTATPDASGNVSLELPVAIDDHSSSVEAFGPGRALRKVDLTVSGGDVVDLGDLQLEPGGTVSGRVVTVDGKPAAAVLVGLGEPDLSPRGIEHRRHWEIGHVVEGVSVRTGDDGTFTLPGIPVGVRRLFAGSGEHRTAASGPVEVREGTESYGLVIRLEPLARQDTIRGRVLTPEGDPMPGANLRYSYKGDRDRRGSGTFTAKQDGTFRVRVHDGAKVYRLRASDPDRRWAGHAVSGVEPGTHDLELRLSRSLFVPLTVRNTAGDPVTRFAVRVLDESEAALLDRYPQEDREDGRLDFRVPGQAFVVRIDADGYDVGKSGPLDVARVTEGFSVTLRPLPGIRGVVLTNNRPVAGARVQILKATDAATTVTHNHFLTRVDHEPVAETTTAPDGSFELTLRTAGTFYLRATGPDLAPTELGPLRLDPELGREGLTLALSPGGAIEGRVLLPPGRQTAGVIVGISRADGHPRTVRTGPDGTYRFEHLTAGPWEVRRLDEELRPGNHATVTRRGTPNFNFNSRVSEGRTTHFDLDLGGSTPVPRVFGRFTLGSRDMKGWTVSVLEEAAGQRLRGGSRTTLDTEGVFQVDTPRQGDWLLTFSGPKGLLRVMAPLTTDGPRVEFTLALDAGTLRISGIPSAGDLPSGVPGYAYLHLTDDGLIVAVAIFPDADGVCTLEDVPAGSGKIVLFDETNPDPDVRNWPAVLKVEVPVGGVREVELP